MLRRLADVASRNSLALALGTALTVSAVASSAGAQTSPDERARLHFQSGAAYYDAGEYESALREFESAYQLSQRPQLFYNMYLCEQSLGNLEAAARHLDAYLAGVPDAENRDNLTMRLANLRERIARRAAGQTDPGPTEEELEAERETEGAVETTSEPEQVEIRPPPPREAEPNVPAIIGFSVAGLGLIGAAIFGPLAIVEDSDLAGGCGATRTCTGAQTSSLETYALLTDISLAVALTGALTGGAFLLFWSDGGDSSEQVALRIAPFATAQSAGVAIGGAL